LANKAERREWLLFEHQRRSLHPNVPISLNIAKALNVDPSVQYAPNACTIEATFVLAGSLLIRSGQHDQGKAPDVVHLTSKRSGDNQPIISGTSLAGVLRHRATKIINTLHLKDTVVQEMFGYEATYAKQTGTPGKASRLTVFESVIEQTKELVQTRIAIDRFTGGALHGALLQEQPIFGGKVTLKFELRDPKNYEVGLLLLLLKDLWTEDLPIGGSSSVGRGRLKGQVATITFNTSTSQKWKIEQNDNHQLSITDLQDSSQSEVQAIKSLQAFVTALQGENNDQLD
jgi:CRISPR/Cas system CSM-associated protein Csm3 (group 7 of RAMP superfamily)